MCFQYNILYTGEIHLPDDWNDIFPLCALRTKTIILTLQMLRTKGFYQFKIINILGIWNETERANYVMGLRPL